MGNDQNNRLTGNDADNVIDGGLGADTQWLAVQAMTLTLLIIQVM